MTAIVDTHFSPLFRSHLFTSGILYPELIDQVIDHCHSDLETLRNCSLVNKTWLPSSRFHLFSHIRLLESNHSTFINLITSTNSTLPFYINSIEVFRDHSQENSEWLNKVIPFLTNHLPWQLSSVSISIADARLSGRSREALEVGFTELVELKLVDVLFNTFDEVRELICSFPVLEKLSLDGIWDDQFRDSLSGSSATWTESHPTTDNSGNDKDRMTTSGFTTRGIGSSRLLNLPSPAKTLREVELATCRTHDVLGWFLLLDPVPVFPVLRLGHIIVDELPAIKQYLQVAGDSLEHLTMQPEREVQHIFADLDFSNLTSLKSLTLDGVFCSSDTSLFARVLSQIQSPSLRRVTLASCMGTRLPYNPQDWVSIDEALTRFSRLEKVVVTSKLIGTPQEPQLPKSNDRGILNVCTHQRPLL